MEAEQEHAREPRAALQAAVAARLARVEESQDPTPVLEPEAVQDAHRLTSLLSENDSDLQSRYLLGWLHWYRYQALPEGQDQHDLHAAVDLLTHCFAAGVEPEQLPAPLLALLADRAAPIAAALQSTLGRADQVLLSASVELWQRILAATPTDHPDRAMYLSNLGFGLGVRFERTGALADLEAAIQVGQEAVAATPTDHPDRAAHLSNLGALLRARFERAGALADLDTAIDTFREAVAATPTDHPNRAGRLNNLGNALGVRFERTGALADLEAAIQVGQEAVAATPTDHPGRAVHLSNLGGALQVRFARMGALADLEAAIDSFREAVAATPTDHPDRAAHLNGLGGALKRRFERTGALADLDTAIDSFREAVAATPTDHPNRAMYLNGLGGALQVRFERTEALADLDAAIQVGQEAVAATPTDHPNRARRLNNLGNALRSRFERTGAQDDLEAALSAHSLAAEVDSAPPSLRIRAARAAAALSARSEPGRAAKLLERAVWLLPEVAPRRLERGDQQHAIGRFAGLAADAAALALNDPTTPASQRAAVALRLLEAGRAVLLSQALHTRGDLSDLTEHHPNLAARFTQLRDLLDQVSDAPALAPAIGGTGAGTGSDRAANDRRQLAEEFTGLLTRIRALEGFASFALPPATSELLAQASHGPIVAFNVSRYRSDALLLTQDGITHLPLPGLPIDTLIDQINTFHRALHATGHGRTSQDRQAAQLQLNQVLGWLWDNAAGPVLDALGHHHPPAPHQSWRRVWWAPGGLLGLLPLHAAGHHTTTPDPAARAVMDRVISSYTPTISALRHARRHFSTAGPAVAGRALIVAMPTTPGVPGRLDYVPEEARMLATRLPGSATLIEPDLGSSGTPPQTATGAVAATTLPTKANVLDLLPACSIAHFACHGVNDPEDPSRSRLLLHDHHTAPLTVAALAPVRLDHAQLAYLSACETALTTNTELIDEAIHLTSAFQLAGYPHVIGTLWAINDTIAAQITKAFYTALTTSTAHGPIIELGQAAHALHHAVRSIRAKFPATPSLWAAHLHAGA
ncbi:CHAT domain-containing tetratricopeptide repeat protein [Actinoallomurus rhizosphaericola]|uniref:CHAT domain-containing tetratricopeptide repeat protein n=1 Tax=Actinoallomurus rhizosphaericola TaxID=2952536 RepID=UPI002093E374|nr:CHAT domain-containing tetratricopeptide repeat protein [Actinoallomurus rhizosphaericola]MCO5999815.1 CHAT domain-containing tetratricopeptide repeat protein [Actinoallomurus rhizosphaericola]